MTISGAICDPTQPTGRIPHSYEQLLPHADSRGAFHVYRCRACRRVTTEPMEAPTTEPDVDRAEPRSAGRHRAPETNP